MRISGPELILVLAIVILIFGVGRIGKIARELGDGIRAFRAGLQGDGETPDKNKDSEVEKHDDKNSST